MTTTELAPGWSVITEDSTTNHWVGSCRDIALVFAYEGSHDDVRHVHATTRVLTRLRAEFKAPVKLLFALPPQHTKAPDARVRSALSEHASRLDAVVSRASVVVSGTGFAAAIQRGAVAGVLTVIRPKVPIRVWGTVREGITYIAGDGCTVLEPLVALCEQRLRGPTM